MMDATGVGSDDRGLLYGDGLFETLCVREGRIRLLERHLQRLESSCERLGIALPPIDALRAELLSAAQTQGDGILKLIVTRGAGGRGYRPAPAMQPTLRLTRHALPEYPAAWRQDGIQVRWCETRLGRNPALAGMKHLNRLEQVLARREWDDPAIVEGLMRDSEGNVVEGTMSNLFCVIAGELLTPRLDACGVAGVMRAWLLDTAAARGIQVRETDLSPAAVEAADELLVCNSVVGIWPVAGLANTRFPVGPVTRQLIELWGSSEA